MIMATFRSALPCLAPLVSGRASYYRYYISYGHITGCSVTGMTTTSKQEKIGDQVGRSQEVFSGAWSGATLDSRLGSL